MDAAASAKGDPGREALDAFVKAIERAKLDRDQMLSKPQATPVPRFRLLVAQMATFCRREPADSALTRRELLGINERMAETFLKKHDVGSESVDYFTLISEVFCEFCKHLLSPNKINKHQYELVNFSLLIFRSLSYYSARFSWRVVNNDELMLMILKVIQRFQEQLVKDTLTHDYVQLLTSATGVVYNLVRLSDSDNVMQVRKFGFIEAVKPLLGSKAAAIRDHANLILIFAASEEDVQKCCCKEPIINSLIIKLREALKSTEHKSEGCSDSELMEAIRKLAVIDENKKILAKLDCLQLMKGVLENYQFGDDDEVVSLAFAILSQLAFDPDNAKWIAKEMQRLLDSKFLKSPNSHLREAARNLKGIAKPAVPTPPPTPRGARERPQSAVLKRPASARPSPAQKHIMVSYNHASKDFVKKLVHTLESADLGKVWVDWSDMKESWLDDMAYAVENAWVVLVCVSLKYKDSENCRREAMYAATCGVPIIPLKVEKWRPDGWVGILIAEKLYYNFSKEDSNEKTTENLLRRLREKREETARQEPERAAAAASHSPKSQLAVEKSLSQWNEAEVRRWCQQHAIPLNKCTNLDGDQLYMLKEMHENAKDAFYRQLQGFNFDVQETSAFKKALDSL